MFEIFAADCGALTPEAIPPGAVMITDPPYSPHVHAGMTSAIGAAPGTRKRDAGFASLSPELRAHIAAIGARCRWAVVFCDWEGLCGWIDAFAAHDGVRYVRAVPWIRWSMPQLSGDRPPQGSECVALFGTTAKLHWNGPGNLTHFDAACLRGAEKHTTEKPLDLMLELIEYFSDPGELVIDPCCGRGTTILAAELLGRHGLGFEVDPAEAERARARCAARGLPRDAQRVARYMAGAEARKIDGERRYAVSQKAKERSNARRNAQRKTH